jgi:hypothetical protein
MGLEFKLSEAVYLVFCQRHSMPSKQFRTINTPLKDF